MTGAKCLMDSVLALARLGSAKVGKSDNWDDSFTHSKARYGDHFRCWFFLREQYRKNWDIW